MIIAILHSLEAMFWSILLYCLVKLVGVVFVLPFIKRKDVFSLPFTSGEFAEKLLREAGVPYRVERDEFAETGICNHEKKQIILTYDLNSRFALALFEAGHEAGHAVRGPHFFAKHRILTLVLHVLMVGTALVGGLMGVSAPLSLVVPFVVAPAFFFAGMWKSEIGASKHGFKRLLEAPLEDDARKLIRSKMLYDFSVITGEALAWVAIYLSSAWFLYELGRSLKGW